MQVPGEVTLELQPTDPSWDRGPITLYALLRPASVSASVKSSASATPGSALQPSGPSVMLLLKVSEPEV